MSPLEAFTASSDGMELVLLGTIETAHHTTPDQPKEDQFVFRMSLTQIGGKLKIKRYESMLVSPCGFFSSIINRDPGRLL